MTASLVTLGDERFVSLTTFRRTGEPVATPVWVVRDGATLVIYTVAESGEVGRIRRDAHVELRACDRRGRVAEGTPVVPATAVVDESAEGVALTERLLRAKYGWEFGGIRLCSTPSASWDARAARAPAWCCASHRCEQPAARVAEGMADLESCELERTVRSFPDTPLSSGLARTQTRVR